MRQAFAQRQLTTNDVVVAAALALALFTIYLITFAGQLHSIDELALFGMTERAAQGVGLTPMLVRFAPFHNPVGSLEPGYALLAAPLYWLGRAWPFVSNIHVVMLLNPLLTAANVGMLYLLGRQLNYERAASLLTALAFGLASMAWPYTKSFLREPAVGLLLTLAYWGLAIFLQRPNGRAGLAVIVPMLLAVGVKLSMLVVWPVMAGALAWALYRAGKLRRRSLVSVAMLGLAGSALAALWLLPQRGINALLMLQGFLAEPFSAQSLLPWYGLFFSPGKSLFIYSPALVVSVVGAWPFFRKHSALAVSVLLTVCAVMVSLRYGMWWGGLTWGPRFLLPLLPLLMLPALEILPRQWWAVSLVALSAVYQALVAMSDWSRVYNVLLGFYADNTLGLLWSHWADSPAIKLLALWGRALFDLIWLHTGLAGEVKLDVAGALGLILLSAVGLWAFGAVWRGWTRAIWVGALAALLAVPLLLARAYADLPDYPGLFADTARRLAEDAGHSAYAPEKILYVSSDVATYPWLGLVKGSAHALWLSPAETAGTFDEALLPDTTGGRVVVVVDRPHIASHYPGDRLVTWLNTRAYRLESHWLNGIEIFNYAVFPDPNAFTPLNVAWPNGVRLTAASVPTTATRGTALPITLSLICESDSWIHSDQLFTNLVGSSGVVFTGQRGELQYGNLAASGWWAGQKAVERRGIWLPLDAPPGDYELVVGFADAHGFVPATLSDGQLADYVTVAHVTIMP